MYSREAGFMDPVCGVQIAGEVQALIPYGVFCQKKEVFHRLRV